MLLLALVASSWLDRWVNDPLSVTTLAIALIGGGFALFRFRFVPSERRRETLDAMQKSFAASKPERDRVLPAFPPFLALGRDAVASAVQAAQPRHAGLLADIESWKSVTGTSADEILTNEVKFRSLLWAIREVRSFGDLNMAHVDGEERNRRQEEHETKQAAERLVAKLNDFAQLVELNLFRQKDVLAQLHRGIAPAAKAIEPLIWSRVEGRWGLRVLRLMIRSEHYNDAKRIHRTSDLTWGRRGEGPHRVVIRERLYRDEFGKIVQAPRMSSMSRFERAAYHVGATWAVARGRFGGSRLRHHRRREDELRGWLRFAEAAGLDPLDLEGWDMDRVRRDIEKYRNATQREPALSRA
jgi:hypothetical protein